jgi:uncharacterized protein
MRYPVDIELSLALVATEAQADSLPDGYEPLVLDSPMLSLIALVEDELILALPIVALHPDSECSVKTTGSGDAAVPADKPHPFAALAQLKGKLDSTH